jgi:hypothetical protein
MRWARALLAAASRVIVGTLLALVVRTVCRMEFHGLEYDTRAPRTYLAITHKRDLDAMGPVPWLLWHRGWRAITGEVHFAMRGDVFTRGFLARIVDRPRWVAWLLRPLAIGPIVHALGIHPLVDLHLRPGEEWVRDALRAGGDRDADVVLTPTFLRVLADAAHEPAERVAGQPLSGLLAWRYAAVMRVWWDVDIFLPEPRRAAEVRTVASAKRALDDIAGWLRVGGSLLSAPEGKLSPDGTLSPVNGGFHRIITAAPVGTRVLPIAIVYDAMTTGRPRMFVDLAPAIESAPAVPRAALDGALRQAWLGAARLTCSQIASGAIVRAAQEPGAAFTRADLTRAVRAQAMHLAAAGRHVDGRLLRSGTARRAVARYLRYAARHQIVRRAGAGAGRDAWVALPAALEVRVRSGETGYTRFPLAYAYNELREMLAGEAADVASVTAELRTHE